MPKTKVKTCTNCGNIFTTAFDLELCAECIKEADSAYINEMFGSDEYMDPEENQGLRTKGLPRTYHEIDDVVKALEDATEGLGTDDLV